jgi:hypothetical protein
MREQMEQRECPPADTECRLQRMEAHQQMMGQHMQMMHQMMEHMMSGMAEAEVAPSTDTEHEEHH